MLRPIKSRHGPSNSLSNDFSRDDDRLAHNENSTFKPAARGYFEDSENANSIKSVKRAHKVEHTQTFNEEKSEVVTWNGNNKSQKRSKSENPKSKDDDLGSQGSNKRESSSSSSSSDGYTGIFNAKDKEIKKLRKLIAKLSSKNASLVTLEQKNKTLKSKVKEYEEQIQEITQRFESELLKARQTITTLKAKLQFYQKEMFGSTREEPESDRNSFQPNPLYSHSTKDHRSERPIKSQSNSVTRNNRQVLTTDDLKHNLKIETDFDNKAKFKQFVQDLQRRVKHLEFENKMLNEQAVQSELQSRMTVDRARDSDPDYPLSVSQKKLAQALEELEALKDSKHQVDLILDSRMNVIKEMQAKIQLSNDRIRFLEDLNEEKESVLTKNYEVQIQKLVRVIEDKDHLIDNLKIELSRNRNKLHSLESSYVSDNRTDISTDAESANWNNIVREKARLISELQLALSKKEREAAMVADKIQENSGLQTKLQELKNELAIKSVSLDILRKENQETLNQKDELQRKKEEMRKQAEDLWTQADTLRRQNNQLKSQVEGVRKQNNDLKNQLGANLDIIAQLRAQNEELMNHTQSHDQALDKQKELTRDIKVLIREHSNLKSLLADKEAALESANRNLSLLEINLSNEKQKLINQLKQLKDENTFLKEQLNSKQKTINELAKTADDLKSRLNFSQINLSSPNQLMHQRSEENAAMLMQMIDQKNATLDELRVEIQSVQNDLELFKERLEKGDSSIVRFLKSEIDRLNRDSQEKSKMIGNLRKTIAGKESRISQLNKDLFSLQDQNQKLEVPTADLNQNLDKDSPQSQNKPSVSPMFPEQRNVIVNSARPSTNSRVSVKSGMRFERPEGQAIMNNQADTNNFAVNIQNTPLDQQGFNTLPRSLSVNNPVRVFGNNPDQPLNNISHNTVNYNINTENQNKTYNNNQISTPRSKTLTPNIPFSPNIHMSFTTRPNSIDSTIKRPTKEFETKKEQQIDQNYDENTEVVEEFAFGPNNKPKVQVKVAAGAFNPSSNKNDTPKSTITQSKGSKEKRNESDYRYESNKDKNNRRSQKKHQEHSESSNDEKDSRHPSTNPKGERRESQNGKEEQRESNDQRSKKKRTKDTINHDKSHSDNSDSEDDQFNGKKKEAKVQAEDKQKEDDKKQFDTVEEVITIRPIQRKKIVTRTTADEHEDPSSSNNKDQRFTSKSISSQNNERNELKIDTRAETSSNLKVSRTFEKQTNRRIFEEEKTEETKVEQLIEASRRLQEIEKALSAKPFEINYIEEVPQQMLELTKQTNKLKTDLQAKESKLTEITMRLKTVEEENQILKSKNESNQTTADNNGKANQEFKSLKRELLDLQTTVEALKGQNKSQSSENLRLQSELKTLKSTIKVSNDDTEKVEKLQEKITEITGDLEAARDRIDELIEQNKSLKNNKDVIDEVLRLRDQVATYTTKQEELEMQLFQEKEEIKDLKSKNNDLRAKSKIEKTEADKLREAISAKDQSFANLEAEAKMPRFSGNDLKKDIQALKVANISLKDEIDKLETAKASLTEQVQELTDKLAKSKEIEDKMSEAIKQKQELVDQLERMKNNHQEKQSDFHNELQQFKERNDELQDIISDLKKKITEKDSRISKLVKEIDELKEEHANSTSILKQTLQDAEYQKVEIMRMLSEFNSETKQQMGITEMKTASTEKSSMQKTLSVESRSQSRGRKSVLEEVKSYSSSFEQIMAGIKQQITEQQAQIQMKDNQIAKLIENIEGQSSKENKELQVQKELVAQLREDNSRLMQDLRDARERIDDLEADIEQAEVINNEFNQLKGTLETLNKEMENLHEKYIDAMSTSDRYQQQRALLIKDLELSQQKCTDLERELYKRVSQVGRLSIKIFVIMSEIERLNGISPENKNTENELANLLTSGVKEPKRTDTMDETLALETAKDSKISNPSTLRRSKIEATNRRRNKLDQLLKGIDAKEDQLKQSNQPEGLTLSTGGNKKQDQKSSIILIPISSGNLEDNKY